METSIPEKFSFVRRFAIDEITISKVMRLMTITTTMTMMMRYFVICCDNDCRYVVTRTNEMGEELRNKTQNANVFILRFEIEIIPVVRQAMARRDGEIACLCHEETLFPQSFPRPSILSGQVLVC